MAEQDREREAMSRLIASGAPQEQARELAPDLAKLAGSLRQARKRLSLELEPAITYQADGGSPP